MFENWFDGFFVFCAIFVALCSSADWLLGEEKRKAMRERAGDFWLRLGESSFYFVTIENIKFTTDAIEKYFGPKAFSIKRIFRVLLYTLASSFLIFFLVQLVIYFGLIDVSGNPLFGLTDPTILIYELPFSVVIDFAAILTTLAIYRRASFGSPMLTPFVGLLVVGIQSAAITSLLTYALYNTVFMACTYGGPPGASVRTLKCVPNPFLLSLFIPMVIHMILTAVLPIVLQICQLIAMLTLKLFRAALQPLVMLILLRLQESDKGVLTNVSILVGAAAKLAQETVKALSK